MAQIVNKNEILEIDSVASCNDHLGVPTLYEHVNVVDLSRLGQVHSQKKKLGVYAIVCYWEDNDEDGGCVRFYSPGHMGVFNAGSYDSPVGWLLTFDSALIENTLLANRMVEYPFFNENTSTSLSLSATERSMIISCMQSLAKELHTPEDRFSARILAAGIAVLLSLSMRYYERQRNVHKDSADIIIERLGKLLAGYVGGDRTTISDIPSVASLAEALHISSNYLGDVVRKKLHCSAHHYIRRIIVQEAKRQLTYTTTPIGEISYNLGFKYPHHFTRVFRREEGISPNQYRKEFGEV